MECGRLKRGWAKWVLAGAMGLLVGAGCSSGEDAKKVSLEKREEVSKAGAPSKQSVVRIAVGAMLVPREGYQHYKDLLDYVSSELGRPVRIVDRESYAEINALLENGELDAAFVCSGPYVDGHEEFGLELLVVPVAFGAPVYYSYIIVPKESPVSSVEELRGKSFAFTDPQSNTGRLVPSYLLASMGEDVDRFFAKTTYTYAHDKSIMAVAEELVDGAAVDSLIWDYADRTDPSLTSRTKIIWKSQPCGIPPVVVRNDIDGELKERLRQIFLEMHLTGKGREILAKMMIDRFQIGKDSAYDSIRAMKRFQAESRARGD